MAQTQQDFEDIVQEILDSDNPHIKGATGCIIGFIENVILNPNVKAIFMSFLVTLEAAVQLQIAQLNALITRLNVLNTINSAIIGSAQAVLNKVKSELTMFFPPEFVQSCPPLQAIATAYGKMSDSGVSKKLKDIKDEMDELNECLQEFQTKLANLKALEELITLLKRAIDP